MKYFLIETDDKITPTPKLIRWFDKLDVRDIHIKSAYKLPDRELIFIESNLETVYVDIISKPVFLMSEKAKKIVNMYEPRTIWKELVLLDKGKGKVSRYFLPVFEEVDCLGDGSVFNLDHSELKRIVLIRNKISEHNIFQIAGVKKQYIIGNLDIVESLLKRNLVGVGITEVETIQEETK